MKHQGKQHFSHDHMLIHLQLDEGEEIKCKACEELIEEPFYGCPGCEFCLHETCLEAPRSIEHPSHPSHPLALHPTPTYPDRSYICDACGLQGKAFSFSCAHCEFDLHLPCVTFPETLTVEDEHPHELKLVFKPPCKDGTTELVACRICRLTEYQGYFWSYYCGACEFVVHIRCLVSKLEKKETDESEVSVKGEESSGDGKQEPETDKSKVSVKGESSGEGKQEPETDKSEVSVKGESSGDRKQEPETDKSEVSVKGESSGDHGKQEPAEGSTDEEDSTDEEEDDEIIEAQMRMLGYVVSAYANALMLDARDD